MDDKYKFIPIYVSHFFSVFSSKFIVVKNNVGMLVYRGYSDMPIYIAHGHHMAILWQKPYVNVDFQVHKTTHTKFLVLLSEMFTKSMREGIHLSLFIVIFRHHRNVKFGHVH